jgi:hypothetical protein
VWGGSIATNYAYQTAFANDPEWLIDLLPRPEIRNIRDIMNFCKGADLIHVDDTSICDMICKSQIPEIQPDVIGPITRSPVKNYKGWTCPYDANWFYNSVVIRLNYNEERKHKHLVRLIVHGVDTNKLTFEQGKPRTDILWAGQKARYAKNHELWEEIQSTPAPPGFNYKTMSQYNVEDYWEALKTAAVVVCTSRYESFCNAAFEAMSCGVPVVWQRALQGPGFWEDAGIRCPYTAEGFVRGITQALEFSDDDRQATRQYVVDNCSLMHMRNSYVERFTEATSLKVLRGAGHA